MNTITRLAVALCTQTPVKYRHFHALQAKREEATSLDEADGISEEVDRARIARWVLSYEQENGLLEFDQSQAFGVGAVKLVLVGALECVSEDRSA